MANVVVNDFLAKYTQKRGERFQIMLNKSLIVLIGAACIGFGYLSNALPGGIIEAALSGLTILNLNLQTALLTPESQSMESLVGQLLPCFLWDFCFPLSVLKARL